MLKIIQRYKNSEMAKNMLTLGIGTSVAQIFPLLFYPVLSRIFTPADFGLLATITSVTAVVSVLATLRYENAILIAKSKIDAGNIVVLIIILAITISSLSYLILFLLGNQLNILFKEPQLSKWLWIVPISSISIVIFNTYNEWCVRNKYFKYLSYNKISNSSGIVLSKLFFGFYTIFGKGLLIGDVLGRVISATTCIYRAFKKDKESLSSFSTQKIVQMGKEFIDCPKFLLPAGLLDVLVMNMAVFMFSSFFTSSEVGYYSMAMAILSLPASVVAVAVKDVFRQRANEDYVNTGSCRPIFKKTVIYMGLGALTICILFFFISPSLVDFFLGKPWRMTGIYASILLPWVATDFVYSSISGVFIIANKMGLSLWLFFLSFLASLIPLSIGCFYYQDIIISLSLMVVFRIFFNIYRTLLAYKYTQIIKYGI